MTYHGLVPVATPETEGFWRAASEGRLVVQRCDTCLQRRFPPVPACAACASTARSWLSAAGTGTVYSYVVNHRAAPGYESAVPYCTAVIELTEGVRMMSTLVGVHARDDTSLLDALVRVEFERISLEIALPRFRPVNRDRA